MATGNNYSKWRKPGKWQSNQANDARMMVYAAKRKSGKPESNQANANIWTVYAALGPHWPILIFQSNDFAASQTEQAISSNFTCI